ncbi:hypothetical protein [Celeribacter sp.]
MSKVIQNGQKPKIIVLNNSAELCEQPVVFMAHPMEMSQKLA